MDRQPKYFFIWFILYNHIEIPAQFIYPLSQKSCDRKFLHFLIYFCFFLGYPTNEQINGITAFVDASNVYGSDIETANILRTHATGDSPGQLKINDGLLPVIDGVFKGGDTRAREMPALSAMHTVWLREHNRIGKKEAPKM